MSAPAWARELVASVCADADVEPPRLLWRVRRAVPSTGVARRSDGTISVRAGSDPLDQRLTLLHELAHWIAPAARRRGRRSRSPRPHLLRGRLRPLPPPRHPRRRCAAARVGALPVRPCPRRRSRGAGRGRRALRASDEAQGATAPSVARAGPRARDPARARRTLVGVRRLPPASGRPEPAPRPACPSPRPPRPDDGGRVARSLDRGRHSEPIPRERGRIGKPSDAVGAPRIDVGDQVLDPELRIAGEGVGHLLARSADRALRGVRGRALEGDRDARRSGSAWRDRAPRRRARRGRSPGACAGRRRSRGTRTRPRSTGRRTSPRARASAAACRRSGSAGRRGGSREAAARRPRRGGIDPRSSLARRGGAARGSRGSPRSG